MLIDKALYQHVQRTVNGDYHCYAGSLATWQERVAALSYFCANDSIAIVRCCAQLADAADAAATITGRTPSGDHRPWRGKVEDALDLSLSKAEPVFMACAERADALESFWQAIIPRAAIVAA